MCHYWLYLDTTRTLVRPESCFPWRCDIYRGPLGDITFCPTGGISIETAPQFLACKNVACVGGSWLTPKDAMQSANWLRITELAQAASQLRKAD
jgi:2-keto-3-deoxy-6-phosphogluconate aldolase